MMSLAIAALFLARLVVSAPVSLVARAPASISFNSPPTILATCSEPVTLSWTVRPSTDDDDDTPASDVRVSRVVVASTTSSFTRTIVTDPETRTFVWEQVNVAPGEYVITGVASGSENVDIRASNRFTVHASEFVDCVQPAISVSSSTTEASSSTTQSETASPTQNAVFEGGAQPREVPANSSASPSPDSAATGSSTSVNGGLIAAIIIAVIVVFAAGAGVLYWRRVNRARQLVHIEYVYPPGAQPEPRKSEAARRSSDDTVIEVVARAPTPVGMLSRTTTKQQMLASDLDLNQTQKMLRQL